MVLDDNKLNILVRLLKKTGLISLDFIYRLYYMAIFGTKIFYRHKISSYRSCAFCKHLVFDKCISKYICKHGEYEACSSIVPGIIPNPSIHGGLYFEEEDEQVPWLFKETCSNFEVLELKEYFRNFVSFDLNTSVIKLESIEGILLGSCSGELPCHICASVNKEIYTKCRYLAKASQLGKCSVIYDNLSEIYTTCTELSTAS